MPDRDQRFEGRRALLKKGGIVASIISIAGCTTQSNEGVNSTPTDNSGTDQDSGDATGSTDTSTDDVTLHGFKPWNVVPSRGDLRKNGRYTFIYHNISEYSSASDVPLAAHYGNVPEILSDDGHFATLTDIGLGVRWDINVDEHLDLYKSYVEDEEGSYSWGQKETIGDYTVHSLTNRDQVTVDRVATKPNTFIQNTGGGRITDVGFELSLDSDPITWVDSQISTMVRQLPRRMHMEIVPFQRPVEIDETNTKHTAFGSSIDLDIDSGVEEQWQLTYMMRLESGDPNAIFNAVESEKLRLSAITGTNDAGRASEFKRTIQNMSVDGDFVTIEASYERTPQESVETSSGEAAQMAQKYDPLSIMPAIENRSDSDFVRPWHAVCVYAPLNDYVDILGDLDVTISEMDTTLGTSALNGYFECGSLSGQDETISGVFDLYTDFNKEQFLESEDWSRNNQDQGMLGDYDLYTIGESIGAAVSPTGFLYQFSDPPIEQTLLNLRTQVKTINGNAPSAEEDTQVSQLRTIAEGNLVESYDRSGQSNGGFWTARMNTISAVNDTTIRFQTAYSLAAGSNPSRETLIQEEISQPYEDPKITQENGIALLEEVRSVED